jgi:hypothetical protein
VWAIKAEEQWNGKVLGPGEQVGYNLGWGSVLEWVYKDRCVKVEVSDDGYPLNAAVGGKTETELLYLER